MRSADLFSKLEVFIKIFQGHHMSATQIESRAGPTFSLNVYCGKKIAKNKKKNCWLLS